jgi:hypothetical protein
VRTAERCRLLFRSSPPGSLPDRCQATKGDGNPCSKYENPARSRV